MTSANYLNIVKILSEQQLRELARILLLKTERVDDVRITDGPWDGGCDLTLHRNGRLIKKTIQATVQSNDLDGKFAEDLDKAEKNIKNKQFLPNFIFITSNPVSQGKQTDWDNKAAAKNIELTVYDAKAIAEKAEAYHEIADYLVSVYTGDAPKISLEQYVKDKNLYDILALGKDSNDIKLGFLKSFIRVFLYDHPCSTVKEIKEYIDSKYNEDIHEITLKKILKDCRNEENPTIKADSGKYSLTDSAIKEYESVTNQTRFEETELRKELGAVLDKVGYAAKLDEFIAFIEANYRRAYNLEISRLTNYGDTEKRQVAIRESVAQYFEQAAVSDEEKSAATENICEIITENKYFDKIGRSYLFHTLLKDGAIDNYLNVINKIVFLDTQVLLQLICVQFAPKLDYSNPSYNAVRHLWEQNVRLGSKIKLVTTYDYLDEVVHHLADARRLRTFVDMADFSLLGGSKNVFINFFLYLRDRAVGFGFKEFDEFLSELLGENYQPDLNEDDFINFAHRILFDNLKEDGVEVKTFPPLAYSVFLGEMKKFEMHLLEFGITRKSKHARKTDLNMMLMLDSEDVQTRRIEGQIITDAPFLVTWDTTFVRCVEKYSLRSDSRIKGNWHVYSPQTMANRLSLATLELNPESVNYDIINHAENLYFNGNSFLDILAQLADPATSMSFTRKILDLKKKQLSASNPGDLARKENKTAIDFVLEAVYYHYSKSKKHNLSDIRKLAEDDDKFDKFTEIIDNCCKSYDRKTGVPVKFFNELDELLEQ